jgi:hypothetical protein
VLCLQLAIALFTWHINRREQNRIIIRKIIIIIILGISFMQGIYTYIPEANHVPREHRVAAILM